MRAGCGITVMEGSTRLGTSSEPDVMARRSPPSAVMACAVRCAQDAAAESVVWPLPRIDARSGLLLVGELEMARLTGGGEDRGSLVEDGRALRQHLGVTLPLELPSMKHSA